MRGFAVDKLIALDPLPGSSPGSHVADVICAAEPSARIAAPCSTSTPPEYTWCGCAGLPSHGTVTAYWNVGSHASPIAFPLLSAWSGLKTYGQLSLPSGR